jgi:DNA-binding NarL/FixJ family response regulator
MGAELAGCAAATVGPCPPRTARRTIRVVVAEAHPLFREGLIRALDGDPGIEVVGEADNGITAIELARQLKPDVMVLDLRMPGTGGAAIVKRLRAEMPEVRALVMTANESPESLLDAVAAGAAGYLSKRTTGEELRQAVITACDGGAVITPEVADDLVSEFSRRAREGGSPLQLLPVARQLEIMRVLGSGLRDDEGGKHQHISPRRAKDQEARPDEMLARWATAVIRRCMP